MTKRILVTGANGFVGSALVRALANTDDEVYATVRSIPRAGNLRGLEKRVHLRECDLLDRTAMALLVDAIRPDVCLHPAWYAEPALYMDSPLNLDYVSASLELAKTLERVGCRKLVGVGTCTEYDLSLGWLSETTPTKPARLYSAAKLALWLVLERFATQSSMTVAWGRVFLLYGPNEDRRRLVPSVLLGLLRGHAVPVTTGDQIRDYLHVDDVASAILAIAESAASGAFNIGSGIPISVRDVIQTMATVTGRPDLIQYGARTPASWEPPFICANVTRLRTETSWAPKYTLESGIQATLDWWRSQDLSRFSPA